MFVLLVQVYCFQSSFFNNLSERRFAPNFLRNWMVLFSISIINVKLKASAIL